ncbi:MAG: hypothetical protein ACLFP2_04985 [Candidatus Woesearchaeota archaeon]
MNENTYYAKEELKRVDHLIYVSLKYTRTGDVIKSVVNRLVAAFEYLSQGIIEHINEEADIEMTKVPLIQAKMVKEHFAESRIINEGMDLYLFLRKLNISKYTSVNEYRRNVTTTFNVDDENIELTIDSVMAYYKQVLELVEVLEEKEIL